MNKDETYLKGSNNSSLKNVSIKNRSNSFSTEKEMLKTTQS